MPAFCGLFDSGTGTILAMARKKLRLDAEIVSMATNNVHEIIGRIQKEFEGSGDIKRDFRNAVLANTLGLITQIAEKDDLSSRDKIDLLTQVYKTVADAIEKYFEPETAAPLKDWNQEKKGSDPFVFIRDNFPTYGHGLTLRQVRKANKRLAKNLENKKFLGQWPDWFSLSAHTPDKTEGVVLGAQLSLIGKSDDPPAVRRARDRALYRQKKGDNFSR